MLSALLLLACSAAPPTIELVDPAQGKPGQELRVVGANFAEGATAAVGDKPLVEQQRRGSTVIEGKVPEGLGPGAHVVSVTNPNGDGVAKPDGFTVPEAPAALTPCGGEYTTYSAVATDTQVIKLDRHWPKEEGQEEARREVLELPFRDIEAVEYQATIEADEWCSAIIIRMKGGERHLFDDDHDTDLKSRAQEIAQGIGRGIDVLAEEARPEAE